jgi:hypothetical protein
VICRAASFSFGAPDDIAGFEKHLLLLVGGGVFVHQFLIGIFTGPKTGLAAGTGDQSENEHGQQAKPDWFWGGNGFHAFSGLMIQK